MRRSHRGAAPGRPCRHRMPRGSWVRGTDARVRIPARVTVPVVFTTSWGTRPGTRPVTGSTLLDHSGSGRPTSRPPADPSAPARDDGALHAYNVSVGRLG